MCPGAEHNVAVLGVAVSTECCHAGPTLPSGLHAVGQAHASDNLKYLTAIGLQACC